MTAGGSVFRQEADEVAQRLSGVLDLDVLSARAAAEVHRLLNDHLICVTHVDHDDGGGVGQYDHGPWLEVGAARGHRGFDLAGLRIPPGTGIGGLVANRCEVVSVSDYVREAATRDFVGLMVEREGIRGAAGVPLWSDGRLCGVLFAGRRHDGEVATRALELLVEVSGHLGRMIGRARKVQQLIELARGEERNRVATELHDDATQLLFAVGVAARRAREAIGDTSPRAQRELERVESLTSSVATVVRSTLRAAAPVRPEQGLPLMIRSVVNRFVETTAVPVEFVVLDAVPPQPADVCRFLVQVVREALGNVAKHAPGATAAVTLMSEDRDLSLLVQDDGPGLPPDFVVEALSPTHSGDQFGLSNLAHHAALLGAVLSVRNNDDGATLRVSIPKAELR